MSKFIYCIALFVHFSIPLFAQHGERVVGIFKTSEDFSRGNLSYVIDHTSKKSKILLNAFFNKRYITVKKNDTSLQLFKDSIWGYANFNKQVYRFFHKKQLLLLNQDEEIFIYKHIVSKPPLGRTNVTNYYFSRGKDARVQSLTIGNLKTAFGTNTMFQNLIVQNFQYNTDLASFDECKKMYRLNGLLKETGN